MPLWAVVVVACAIAPFVIRAWIDAEARRAKGRTASLLASLGLRPPRTSKRARADVGGAASGGAAERDEAGSPLAASTHRSSPAPDAKGDEEDPA